MGGITGDHGVLVVALDDDGDMTRRVAGCRHRADPWGDGVLEFDQIDETSIEQRLDRAGKLVQLTLGFEVIELGLGEDVAGIGKGRYPLAVDDPGVPPDVVEVKMRAEHHIDCFEATVDGLGQAFGKARIPWQRMRSVDADTCVDHDGRSARLHDEGMYREHQIIVGVDVRIDPRTGGSDVLIGDVRHDLMARNCDHRLFDFGDENVTNRPLQCLDHSAILPDRTTPGQVDWPRLDQRRPSDQNCAVPARPQRPVTRRRVIQAGAASGLAALLAGCADLFEDDEGGGGSSSAAKTETVIVVGAGAAGMSAAALLVRAGLDVLVLEAGPTYGGRIRHDLDFVDFPIPLGAEWLHEDPDEMAVIADDPDVDVALAAYQPTDEVGFFDGELSIETMGDDVDTDLKFVGSSWLDFFETYVLPDIEGAIEFGVEIVRVDETGAEVVLTDATGGEYSADQVIVTVPLKLLQEERIEFIPPLPEAHREAIDAAEIWGGMKVFIEFADRFYPTFVAFADSDSTAGQRLYYDAAYGQDSASNVLGLFAVGQPAERYQALDAGDELRDLMLAELDEIFDGAASANYLEHVAQDWNDEPFARAAYLSDDADEWIPQQLHERFSNRVLLAGDSYTGHGDWSAVDDAARSARDAVRDLLR